MMDATFGLRIGRPTESLDGAARETRLASHYDNTADAATTRLRGRCGCVMIVCEAAPVVANQPIGGSLHKIKIVAPAIARAIRPGQFVMVRVRGRTDPLLARPLALYDTADDATGAATAIELVYLVLGLGTKSFQGLRPGDPVDVWGPLGNGFPRRADEACLDRLMILAGGVGQTPFLAVLKDLLGLRSYGDDASRTPAVRPGRVAFCWGVRTSSSLAGLNDFRLPGVDVYTATDDGSSGFHGNVIGLAESLFSAEGRPTAIFACGPDPMLEAVSNLADVENVPAWVSLETKMACGYGVCFSCVCAVRDERAEAGWDYRRVCLEGAVFPSKSIVWRV